MYSSYPVKGMLNKLAGIWQGRSLLPFVGLSLLLHALPATLVWGLDLDLSLPKPEINWLNLDNTLGAPSASPQAPPPPPPPPETKKEPPPPEDTAAVKPKKKKKKRRKKRVKLPPDAGPPGPQEPFSTDELALGSLAAGDAALMLLLRMDRLRKTPYEAAARRVLEVFYDHKTLLWSSGLDPIRDLDAILIATPNPYRVTRTLLAVRHSHPDRFMRKALSRSTRYEKKRMRWYRQEKGYKGVIPSPPRLPHDPRVVVTRPGLAMLVNPALLPRLDERPAPPPKGGPDAGVAPPPTTWAERLAGMQSTGGGGAKGPAMLLQGINLPRLIRLPPGMPVPLALRVSVEAVEPCRPEGLLTFASEDDARRFMESLPKTMGRARRSILLRLLGVVDLLDAIKLKREGALVRANAELTGGQLRQVMEMFRQMIPQVRVPGMTQSRLPDAGVPDAAKPDQGEPAIEVPSWAE